ncbi:POU domain, class 4, transcription factor 3-like [Symsagittifera roscoffensis]
MFFPTNSISLVGASQQINHVSKNSMQSHTSEHLQSLVDCKPIMHNSATADQLQAAAAAGLHAQHGSVTGSAGGSHGHNEFKYSASPFQIRQRTAFAPPPTSNFFGHPFDDSFFRADSLTSNHMNHMAPKPMDYKPHEYFSTMMADMQNNAARCSQLDLLDQIAPSVQFGGGADQQVNSFHPATHIGFHPSFGHGNMAAAAGLAGPSSFPQITHVPQAEVEADPRELEAFAEKFKQRRIKLGVTQADVGKSLSHLKIPGVGSLSQSTICRFESLTLSHNNMVALKPVLQAWLDEAEAAAKGRLSEKQSSCLSVVDKKRKRTSIAAPEKRSLEAYFTVQPRPSGEKISAIAEKLDLKKNVVRVWFCNQRQKQKRLKFAAGR